MEFPVTDRLKADNPQSSNEKYKEESFAAGLKCDIVKLSSVEYQGKSFVMLGGAEMRWRPKTRVKNKLRLNMKKILNPKLAKEKVTVIEDSSSQEDLEDEKVLASKQVQSKKEHSVTLKSSPEKDKVVE